MLREVTQVLTRQEILASAVYTPGVKPFGMYHDLLREGWQQVDMVDGSVILGRSHFRWTAGSPDAVRYHVCWSPVAKGVALTKGNVVEVEQRGRLATAVRIRHQSLAEGGCDYRTESGVTIATAAGDLSPVGDEGAASLHCARLAEEGWSPKRLDHGVEWRKAPPASSAGASPRSGPTLGSCSYRAMP